jgi:hypothetical protein
MTPMMLMMRGMAQRRCTLAHLSLLGGGVRMGVGVGLGGVELLFATKCWMMPPFVSLNHPSPPTDQEEHDAHADGEEGNKMDEFVNFALQSRDFRLLIARERRNLADDGAKNSSAQRGWGGTGRLS